MSFMRKPWNWLFGKSLTPKEKLRRNRRAITKAISDLDRERVNMENQEKRLIIDIKKMAKDNQNDAVLIIAKDIAQTRRYIKKLMLMRANLQGVGMRIISLQSQNAVAQALTGVTLTMRQMNQELQLPQITKILQEFEKQSTVMEMKDELVGEAIDDAMGEADDEVESDAIVAQIFDELGLQLNDQLSGIPETQGQLKDKSGQKIAAAAAATTTTNTTTSTGLPSPNVDELQARLDELRRNDFPDLPKNNLRRKP